MKYKLSNKLSPRAKKLFLKSASNQPVPLLIQFASTLSVSELIDEIKELGGTYRNYIGEGNLLTVELEPAKLNQLAELRGVTYIEAQTKYSASKDRLTD